MTYFTHWHRRFDHAHRHAAVGWFAQPDRRHQADVSQSVSGPTSLFHECGHQVAGITGWNEAFCPAARRARLSVRGSEIAEIVAGWASEMAADSFAFAYTGYAAVVALVRRGRRPRAEVFRFLPGDPHPISYLRVMLGVEMCRRFYGMGPWDELAAAWQQLYPIHDAPQFSGAVVRAVLPLLPRIVDAALLTPHALFPREESGRARGPAACRRPARSARWSARPAARFHLQPLDLDRMRPAYSAHGLAIRDRTGARSRRF